MIFLLYPLVRELLVFIAYRSWTIAKKREKKKAISKSKLDYRYYTRAA